MTYKITRKEQGHFICDLCGEKLNKGAVPTGKIEIFFTYGSKYNGDDGFYDLCLECSEQVYESVQKLLKKRKTK